MAFLQRRAAEPPRTASANCRGVYRISIIFPKDGSRFSNSRAHGGASPSPDGRCGGQEFVIILPQTRLDNAVTVAEQLRRTMMRHKVVRKNTGDEYGVITISIGASGYRAGEPLADLVRRADAALCHAKHTGRNRVVSEDDVPPEVFAEAAAASAM